MTESTRWSGGTAAKIPFDVLLLQAFFPNAVFMAILLLAPVQTLAQHPGGQGGQGLQFSVFIAVAFAFKLGLHVVVFIIAALQDLETNVSPSELDVLDAS